MKNIKIEELRKQIDLLDIEIVKTLNKRFDLAELIINEKLSLNESIKSVTRENEIINKIISLLENNNHSEFIIDLYKRFFNYSIKNAEMAINEKSIENILLQRPFVIAGPCTVESYNQLSQICLQLKTFGIKLLRGGTFKPRTSPYDFQGMEAEGLNILRKVADENNMFVVTEFLDIDNLKEHYDKIDIIQVGSRNMTSYMFLKQLGRFTSQDKKQILLKRGFASTLKELVLAAEYIINEGNPNVILCLRGIRTFEQIDSSMRYTPDLASILELKEMTNLPIVYDPSHSTGNSKYVIETAKAALLLGADGVMLETHTEPENSVIDSKQAIKPDELSPIIDFIKLNCL